MAESLRCILGHSTLLSQCLSPPRSINGTWYLKKKRERTEKNLFEHMKLGKICLNIWNLWANWRPTKIYMQMVRKPDEMLWRGKGGGNHAMDWYPIQGGREVIILVTEADVLHGVLALCWSKWWRANTRNVSFEILYGGQFTLSIQLIVLNYPVILSHWQRTTVS